MTLLYGLGVCLLAASPVSRSAWLGLYLVCAVACLAISACRLGPDRATSWLIAALYAALIAAIFYGANGALDALHGPGRRAGDVARHLGGLEVWFALCPGAVSVSLGTALGVWVQRRWRCTAA